MRMSLGGDRFDILESGRLRFLNSRLCVFFVGLVFKVFRIDLSFVFFCCGNMVNFII